MSLSSAAGPHRALSGHFADTHVSLGTYQGNSQYSLFTLFVNMGACNVNVIANAQEAAATKLLVLLTFF